tara:strand:+ start:139 stop:1677 length:1539 start_codon:yes stop_codon:yes gene_type:complete
MKLKQVVFWLVLTSLFLPAFVRADDEAKQPNILFAISDDQSYPHASAYGTRGILTPAFDRIAREGVLIHNAIAGSPGCAPSRATLLTGRYPWQNQHAGTHASSFPAALKVYPELLAAHGYQVGYTGKPWGPGRWEVTGRKQNPAGPPFSVLKEKPPGGSISSTDYSGNFKQFLKQRSADQPFCFWFGAHEPHRAFEDGIGVRLGKELDSVDVPGFLPDHEIIRSDILDYYTEIEHFDSHLLAMLEHLQEIGELENTLIVVTSDNGMAFPRAKANCYEYGVHVPMAIRWGEQIEAGQQLNTLVSFVDLAPTFLDAAGVEIPGEMTGQSLLRLCGAGVGNAWRPRSAVFSARERHSSSRYMNWTYPQRVMRTNQYLLIRNFRPDRWPAGDPQKFDREDKLGPMHGGYHDIDACPSLTFLINQRQDPEISPFFRWSVEKRPAWELFDIRKDPDCLNNLVDSRRHAKVNRQLQTEFLEYLTATEDPRVLDGGEIFESYPRYSRIRSFPEPPETLEQ